MASKRIVVAAHGHCFDGVVSAALFTHLRQAIAPSTSMTFSYKSCGYGPNMQTVPERWLKGDENAIVDFRFTESERLTWYFDHHQTAFANEAQERRALKQSKRYFFDPTYPSCTLLIRDVGRERFGVDFDRFADLVDWANRIDSADFDTARDAIDRRPPIKQLAAVVEREGNGPLYNEVVGALLKKTAEDVALSETIQERWRPLAKAQEETEKRIEEVLVRRGAVAFTDLHEAPLAASGKFVAYALAPECTYAVALIRMRKHFKISIGHNPWSGRERRHDIAALCRAHGGGGHPMVGAISVPVDRLAEAQKVTEAVIDHLNE